MHTVELVHNLNTLVPPEHRSLYPVRDPAINQVIGELTQSFAAATEQQREEARAELARPSHSVLLGYAWEMAEEAVSHCSAEFVRQGLIALAIDNGLRDARDNIIRLAPLFRSAQKLGLDAEKLFAEASELCTLPLLKSAMRGFPMRKPEHRDLGKAFFIREHNTKEGFRYTRDRSAFGRAVRRAVWREKLKRFFRLAK
jgi:hypothetical protein